MSKSQSLPLVRQLSVLSALAIFSVALASAQFVPSPNSSHDPSASSSDSSSSSSQLLADDGTDLAALPAAPAAASPGGGQDRNGGYNRTGGYHSHSLWSHLTYEVGGGVNAPAGDKSYITWGGNLTVGGGYRFNQMLSAMLEYQFIDDKIPGAIIAEAGASGGHAHIWSFTVDPTVDLFPKSTNDLYIVGGGGFYRKVTSFTVLAPTQFCTYFYCGVGYEPQTVGHFSSNQGGFNIGGGYMHRMGGMYGDSKMKLFAEVRYLDVLSPALSSSPNGLGVTTVAADTKVLPITLGIRW